MKTQNVRRWRIDLVAAVGVIALWAADRLPFAGRGHDLMLLAVVWATVWLMHRWVRANADALEREQEEQEAARIKAMVADLHGHGHRSRATAPQGRFEAMNTPSGGHHQ